LDFGVQLTGVEDHKVRHGISFDVAILVSRFVILGLDPRIHGGSEMDPGSSPG
jgi:hypothetical protein